MERGKRLLSFLWTKRQREKETSSISFMKNGSALLEDLITTFNGRYKVPIRSFTARALIRATNSFADQVIINDASYRSFRGSLEGRPILVRKFRDNSGVDPDAIHDIVISSQMSHHKNVLNLLGCCLEYTYPALVYEYAGTELLSDLLYSSNDSRSLSWMSRLRIANDVANVILYLHTAFRTPFIHRNLTPSNVIIDQYGVVKLVDFSLCISLPPGKLQVEDDVKGTIGFLDPDYFRSGFVTQKSDVYAFGVLLLVLLTGQKSIRTDDEFNVVHIKNHVKENQFNKIVDSKILDVGGEIEQEQQMHAFLSLALKCIQDKKEDRPEMIDVGKELRQIERSARRH